jgi:hypothetical protein
MLVSSLPAAFHMISVTHARGARGGRMKNAPAQGLQGLMLLRSLEADPVHRPQQIQSEWTALQPRSAGTVPQWVYR